MQGTARYGGSRSGETEAQTSLEPSTHTEALLLCSASTHPAPASTFSLWDPQASSPSGKSSGRKADSGPPRGGRSAQNSFVGHWMGTGCETLRAAQFSLWCLSAPVSQEMLIQKSCWSLSPGQRQGQKEVSGAVGGSQLFSVPGEGPAWARLGQSRQDESHVATVWTCSPGLNYLESPGCEPDIQGSSLYSNP